MRKTALNINSKKRIYILVCLILLISFLVLMLSAVFKIVGNAPCGVPANSAVRTMPSIKIDAGHGGEDGGAVSDSGVLEKDLNLAISNDLSDLFRLFGFDVEQTRTDDSSLSTDGDTVHARKVSDMKQRLGIFNSSDNNVVISIHQNKFPQSRYFGTQIFYSPNNPDSALLAESIRSTVVTLLQNDNTRETKKADSGIYLLKNATAPAVIVECGFISNENELSKLTDNTYQKQMAYSIAVGFLNYYNS